MNMGTQHWLSAAFIQNKPTTHTHTHKKKVHPHHQASKSSPCPPLSAEPPAQLLVLEGQPLHAAPGLGQPALQEVPLLPLLLPPRSQTLEALLHRQVGLTQGLWGFEYAMIVPVKWFELWAFPSPRTAPAGLPQYLHPDMSHQEHNDHSPKLIRALRRTRKQTSLFVVVVQQQQIRSSNKKKTFASALTPPTPISLTLQVSVLLDEDVHLLQGFLQRARLTGRARDVAVHHGASRRHDAERKAKQVRDLFALGLML